MAFVKPIITKSRFRAANTADVTVSLGLSEGRWTLRYRFSPSLMGRLKWAAGARIEWAEGTDEDAGKVQLQIGPVGPMLSVPGGAGTAFGYVRVPDRLVQMHTTPQAQQAAIPCDHRVYGNVLVVTMPAWFEQRRGVELREPQPAPQADLLSAGAG